MHAKQWVTSLLLGLMAINFSGCWGDQLPANEKYPLDGITFNDDTVPVVILGGGIAGLTAAYYCAQARIPCLVLEGSKPGGALTQSHSVRNWPGVLSAPGAEIAASIRKQAVSWGVRIVQERVTSIDCKQWPRVLETHDVMDQSKKHTIRALAVVVAMGTEPNFLGVPGEWGADGYWGRGVTNCAVCEGSLCKGKEVVVVGGGDAAIAETDYLSGIASKVTILVRKDSFNKAKDTAARDAVLARLNVTVSYNTEIKRINGDGKQLTHLTIVNNKTGEESTLKTSALFLAIGSRPNTALFKGQLELDEHGTIVCKHCQETSVRGIYAAGDIADAEFMQAITAAGDAAKAALQAIRFLKKIGYQATTTQAVAKPAEVPVKPTAPKSETTEKPRDKHVVKELKNMRDFESVVLASTKPVVVDLFATWCIPCQRMLPIVDKVATAMADRITFAKINVDTPAIDLEQVLSKLGSEQIKGVPAFLFIKDGKEVGRVVGGRSEEQFKSEIEGALG